jgi:hypothetical protein
VAAPQKEPMPSDTPLTTGCTIEFAAISPTTGAAITGVKVSNVSIYQQSTGDATLEPLGPYMLVPGPNA